MASKSRTCFVPGCKSGYRSCFVKASLFRAPTDAARREIWARQIKRADKELTADGVVCERHFEEQYVEKTFRHMIGGKAVEIPRDRPHLKEEAITTVFPDAPKYFTRKARTKRKERNLCEQKAPPSKRRKVQTAAETQPVNERYVGDSLVYEPAAQADEPQEADVHCICGNLCLPGGCWNQLRLSAESNTVYIGVCERDGEESVVALSADAQAIVDATHTLTMCSGCGMKPAIAGAYFSSKCSLACKGQGPCVPCKCLRKLVQNQLSRRKCSQTAITRLKKHANTHRRLQTVQKKLFNATRELEAMRLVNEQTASEVLLDRIKGLPPKQQLAVTTCFKAAARKSTCGMKYEKDWIFECVLLRMRSPKLYEHLRKQKILILPSRTCLQRYIKNFKSGFGFNENLLKALSVKTESMGSNARHGGIVFDEMKLSEHFSVNAAGAVEGFVDLGKFTPEDKITTPADHGMVMLFQLFQDMLSKLLLEAIILAEQAGLFVDFVSCDGASWNRSMWKSFGIGASSGRITCKATHPVDPTRELHFRSDFPHFVKCVRNSFVDNGFTTPDGRACIEHVKGAWEKDKEALTFKAMPQLTKSHVRPSSFEKMKVNLAFTLFSEEVLKGMFLYKAHLQQSPSSITPTV
ncbi:hypothetical protein HPB48_007886 [Haemaphysalis longicornis]|uniref:THAP-type domain-containing protein n=1 Tax=Haemaphysalis longicornis TaxID=44386 RepID=A0A9J6FUT1_HAELO|nr:hypothetical protein HPB48_007886 [Haemaphysalis longicornis]